MKHSPIVLLLAALVASSSCIAQELKDRPESKVFAVATPAKAPNANATYQQLRNVTVSGESSTVSNLVLRREGATFTFKSGSFYFLTPVNNKVTGAVFQGDGEFTIDPPVQSEKLMLHLLTKSDEFKEIFA